MPLTLRQVSPCATVDNLAHRGGVDCKAGSNGALPYSICRQLTDRQHFLCGQSAHWLRLATQRIDRARRMMTVALKHIAHVIGMGASIQVRLRTIVADARAHVAMVQDVQPLGHRAVSQFPRQAMCHHHAPTTGAPPGSAQHAVPGMVDGALPQPARLSLQNMLPEPILPRGTHIDMLAGVRAELTPVAIGDEGRTACRAGGEHASLLVHRKLSPFGATPPAASTARGLLHALNSTILRRDSAEFAGIIQCHP